MVSTGWRTACTVIIIIIGSALLTFAVFLYRRQKFYVKLPDGPEMQQWSRSSPADDPEAHLSLLRTNELIPPVPPKPSAMSHARSLSDARPSFPSRGRSTSHGQTDEWGGVPSRERTRSTPMRVPVPPMFPERQIVVERPSYHQGEGQSDAAPISMPEPSLPPTPSFLQRIQFPKLQLSNEGGPKGRFPSLRIPFIRESNQVTSSPGDGYHPAPQTEGPPPSASSGPSTLSRPFATMATTPLPHIRPMSPLSISTTSISIKQQSPSTAGARSDTSTVNTPSPQDEPSPLVPTANPTSALPPPPPSKSDLDVSTSPSAQVSALASPRDSVASVSSPASITTARLDDFQRALFSRKLSIEGSASLTLSRGSSQTGSGSPGSGRPVARQSSLSSASLSQSGSASGSGSSSGSDGRGGGNGNGNGNGNLRRATTWVPNVLASYSPWHNVVPLTNGTGSGSGYGYGAESPTSQIRVADAYRPMPTLEENPSEVSPITLPRSLPDSGTMTGTGTGTGLEMEVSLGEVASSVVSTEVERSIARIQSVAVEVEGLLPSPYDLPPSYSHSPSSPSQPPRAGS